MLFFWANVNYCSLGGRIMYCLRGKRLHTARLRLSDSTSIHLPNLDDNGLVPESQVLKWHALRVYTLNPYMLAELPFLLRGRQGGERFGSLSIFSSVESLWVGNTVLGSHPDPLPVVAPAGVLRHGRHP